MNEHVNEKKPGDFDVRRRFKTFSARFAPGGRHVCSEPYLLRTANRSQTMRLPACLLVLCIAEPALAEQKLAHDFRGARFDPEHFRYGGPTPDKFLKLEAE